MTLLALLGLNSFEVDGVLSEVSFSEEYVDQYWKYTPNNALNALTDTLCLD